MATKKKVFCDYCGKATYKYGYLIKKYKHHFCNAECRMKFNTKRTLENKETDVDAVCSNCKNTFFRSHKALEIAKRRNKGGLVFCSVKCSTIYYGKEKYQAPVILTCSECGKTFIRKLSRYKQYTTTNCCSRECAIKFANKRRIPSLENQFFLDILRTCVSKSKNSSMNLTVDYLKSLWDIQNGVCPYTRFELVMTTSRMKGRKKSPKQASLDRINSDIGYVIGNVEFVSLLANYAKNSWSREEIMACFGELRNV